MDTRFWVLGLGGFAALMPTAFALAPRAPGPTIQLPWALLDFDEERLGPVWPVWSVILPVGLAGATIVLMIRGIRGLVRRREGAGTNLCSWYVSVGGATLDLLLVWAWPMDTTLTLAFGAFMLPMALAAIWRACRAMRKLGGAGTMEGPEHPR